MDFTRGMTAKAPGGQVMAGRNRVLEREFNKNMRVLIVEDSLELRRVFARVLKDNGFEVCEASNGQEALAFLSAFAPDVVLTDLNMPQMDGLELARRLRAMPTMKDLPIILMTGAATSEDEREARRAGVADFLAKPIDSWTLIGRLANLHH